MLAASDGQRLAMNWRNAPATHDASLRAADCSRSVESVDMTECPAVVLQWFVFVTKMAHSPFNISKRGSRAISHCTRVTLASIQRDPSPKTSYTEKTHNQAEDESCCRCPGVSSSRSRQRRWRVPASR